MRVTIFDYGAGNLHSLTKALGGNVRVETDPVKAIATDVLVLPGVGNFALAAQRLAPGRDLMRLAIAGGLPTIGICLGMQLLFDTSDEGPGLGLGVFKGRVRRLRATRVPHIGWNSIDDAAKSNSQSAYTSFDVAGRRRKEFEQMSMEGQGVKTATPRTLSPSIRTQSPSTRTGDIESCSFDTLPQGEIASRKVVTELPPPLPPLAYFAHSFVCDPDNESIITATTTHERDTFPSIIRRDNVAGVQFHPEKSGADGVRFLRDLIAATAAP